MGGAVLFCCLLGTFFPRTFFQLIENIALKKPTWQQYPYSALHSGSDLAVDGRKTNYSLGECVLSANFKSTAEWRVDLKQVSQIQYIVIHFRTDDLKWDEHNELTGHFLGFSVYISNTTNKEDGTVCFKDKNYTRATIPNPVLLSCPINGRYVVFYNNRTHKPYPNGYSKYTGNYLCEVEVIGNPIKSFYEVSHSTPCPVDCFDGECDSCGNCLEKDDRKPYECNTD
uniref:Uncharacterized protein LOC111114398 n=1 Tax=Crassostrea virginica TaxID=6565 RepID=A0A8B8BZX6_CRAVI|nr:uncharacterized protein LOC111114398 [Crassostrea virginica]